MEPKPGRGIVENTNQSRLDNGNPSPTLTNQVDINAPLAEASASSMMSASPNSGQGYLVQDSVFTKDVDWRNPNQTYLSSPPTQNMEHEDGYDPNRIPSSIFADTPESPIDWSAASNESLFSIYMGNSFSGCHGVFKSGELGVFKSGELGIFKSGELGSVEGKNSPQNPFETQPNPTATLPEPVTQQSANIKDDIKIQEGPSGKSTAMTEKSKEDHENKACHEETKAASSIPPHKGGITTFETTNSIQNRLSDESAQSSSSKNRLSEESGKSSSSFAFPVLATDCRKSSSFRLKSVKKEEPPQIKQKSEPPEPVATKEAVRRRCCMSIFPKWLRCC